MMSEKFRRKNLIGVQTYHVKSHDRRVWDEDCGFEVCPIRLGCNKNIDVIGLGTSQSIETYTNIRQKKLPCLAKSKTKDDKPLVITSLP